MSNAALHWLEDHARLLERLRKLLVPGAEAGGVRDRAVYAQFLETFRGRLLARLTDARPFLFTLNRILFRAVAPD